MHQVERSMPLIDEWSGLADFLANMIEKYISDLGIDDLPEPVFENINDGEENLEKQNVAKDIVA